mgnify:CR=1 FL=1
MAQVDELTKEIELRLGGQMVDVELDPEHYELSINKSFEKYRQRSENALEEAFVALELTREVSDYTLDNDIVDVGKNIARAKIQGWQKVAKTPLYYNDNTKAKEQKVEKKLSPTNEKTNYRVRDTFELITLDSIKVSKIPIDSPEIQLTKAKIPTVVEGKEEE